MSYPLFLLLLVWQKVMRMTEAKGIHAARLCSLWRTVVQGRRLQVHNVVVTTGQLVPTLAKLLLFRLSGAFPPEGVYSARSAGKQHCFDLVARRFGPAARYLVIGEHGSHHSKAPASSLPCSSSACKVVS